MNASPLTASTSTAIRMSGRDTLDVLHRIGTRDVLDLPPGSARATLFCDFRGRLLHRAWVVHVPDASVWLLRDDAAAAPLLEHLDKHVFREDVKLEDRSETHRVAAIPFGDWENGPGLERRAGALRIENDVPAALVDGHGFVLVVSPPSPAAIVDAAVEVRRIEAARPKHGHEISERFNPYEVGLAGEVHLSKGCYTGQEALQRLVTYASVKRRLARVSGEGLPPLVDERLGSGDVEAGILTSAVARGDSWVGLGAVRREFIDRPLTVADGRPAAIEPLDSPAPLGR